MTVLLVLFTLIGFLVADFLIQRRKRNELASQLLRPVNTLTPSQWHLSNDILLAPNHTWVRREHDNSITVGIDNFVVGLTGAVERIQLPIEGAIVNQASPSFALRDKEKLVRFSSPVDGQIISVNHTLSETPGLVKNNPYTNGWLFNILPNDEAKPFVGFRRGEDAIEWLKKQNELVRDFFNRRMPRLQLVTMQDGGVPVDGLLKGFDQGVWSEFEEQFASLPPLNDPPKTGEYVNA